MRSFWRLVHFYYLGRAVLRGPVYLAGYLVRRAVRRAVWLATRKWR